VVVPKYQLSDVKKTREGDRWVVTARLRNVGTGVMPVEVAATQGERFGKKGDYREARTVVTLVAGMEREVSIRCDFDPAQLVVDPDAKVLMLRRKAATAGL
jgi:ABC-2 type transport system permease protein